MKKEDLIVLRYAQNTCYVNVALANEVHEGDFSIDLEKKIWSYQCWKDVPIGQQRSPYDDHSNKIKSGIIGVYDRSDIKQLSSMVHDAAESLREEAPARIW